MLPSIAVFPGVDEFVATLAVSKQFPVTMLRVVSRHHARHALLADAFSVINAVSESIDGWQHLVYSRGVLEAVLHGIASNLNVPVVVRTGMAVLAAFTGLTSVDDEDGSGDSDEVKGDDGDGAVIVRRPMTADDNRIDPSDKTATFVAEKIAKLNGALPLLLDVLKYYVRDEPVLHSAAIVLENLCQHGECWPDE